MSSPYQEYRCPDCDRLLFKGLLIDSEIEIKCKRCKDIKVITGQAAKDWLCLNPGCHSRVKAQTKT